MSIVVLSNDHPSDTSASRPMVDVVAIHGLYEGQLDTWIDPQTKLLWLRDLFPHDESNVRVLAYGYETESLLDPGGTADGILPYATSLIAELCAFRELSNTSERPIIFICHGFGGILLKRALVFSSASQGDQVQHRRSIYVSTHAIIFMGTPHNGMRKDAILGLSKHKIRGPSQFLLSIIEPSEVLGDITDLFAPMMKRFMISYFWEQLDTKTRFFKGHIVHENSAAPAWHNVDRCGIMASHSDMVKFRSQQDRGYPVVYAALHRYIRDAPEVIGLEWKKQRRLFAEESRSQVQVQHQNYAVAADITQNNISKDPEGINEIYAVPRSSSNYFTGRKLYADDMKEAFNAPRDQSIRHRQKIFVIYGLGGSGKTQFCLKYIEDNKSSYWGVFWIDASSDENAESGFTSLAVQSGKGANFAAGIHWLSAQSKPWILVIDNADDPDMDVSKYFPVGSKGHILVTTRNPGVTSQSTIGSFRFCGMDPEEATALLLRSAHLFSSETSNSQTKALARGIASELGYLALALNHAGETIRRNIYTLDRYLHYYLGYRREMISYSHINTADDANIITTWEIPFRKIEARASVEYRDAVDIMHIFAFMHFKSIPESIFQAFWNATNGTETSFTDYPEILRNPSMLNEEVNARLRSAFRVLYDYSFIDYDPEQKSCSLHPVVHTWARSRLTRDEYVRWLSCTTAMLAHCISSNFEASRRQFRRQLLPHIDEVLRTLHQLFPSFPETTKQAAELDKFASVYAENGLWKQARSLRRKVVELRVKKLGRRHTDTIKAQKALADTYWNLFEVKSCIDIQFDVLKSHWLIRPSLQNWVIWPPWKPDHVSYCIALSDLTQSLWLAGKLDLSKQAGERALEGLMRHLGPDDPITLNAMFNLGRTYQHLREHDKSHRYLVCVVKKRKHFFGPNHPETLMARTELGTSYRALGHMNLAEKMIGNVLEARRKTLSEEHAYTLWSVNELSKILCDRGRSEKAIIMLEDIMPVVMRTLGEDHVGMTMTRSNLARAYAISKRWIDAADILRDLSKGIKAGHPDWFNIMCGYVHVRVKMGLLEETEEDCKELLEAITERKVIALHDPLTFGVAEIMVRIHEKHGREEEIVALKMQLPGLDKVLDEQSTSQNSLFSEFYAAQPDDSTEKLRFVRWV